MKDNIKELNLENELPLEESAAIDRLLSDFAEAENSEVDYASMLASIKAKARKENISVFPAAGKKRGTARRVLTGVGAAAAVFVVGLAAFAVIRALPFPGTNGKTAAGDIISQSDKVIETEQPSGNNVLPDPGKTNPGEKTGKNDSSSPAEPANTAEPVNSEDVSEILPTMFPVKGGLAGFVKLTRFIAAPSCSAQLVPDLLPEFMEFKLSEAEIFASAYGADENVEYSYSCRVIDEADTELDVGVARFIETDGNCLNYLWRVNEELYLEVNFQGFSREAAEELLLSIALCDLEGLPYTPAPTEEAA